VSGEPLFLIGPDPDMTDEEYAEYMRLQYQRMDRNYNSPRKRRQNGQKGYIYFISAPATNSVKIGFSTKHPRTRLRACQTGNADELTLLGWCDGSMGQERAWHERYAEYCIRGEWFRREGEFKEFIDAFLEHYWAECREGDDV
jgi:hypothetical protein